MVTLVFHLDTSNENTQPKMFLQNLLVLLFFSLVQFI